MSVTAVHTVTGMTCGHCVQAVTDEISSLAGVQNVNVDLENGLVTVVSSGPLTDEAIAAAVDDAGHALAP